MSDTTGPGPGAYKLKSLTEAFNYDGSTHKDMECSFGRKSPLSKQLVTPAPYKLNDATRFGMPGNTNCTIGSRHHEQMDPIGPGPTTYNIKSCSDTPAWNFGEKCELPKALYSPGPADYSIPSSLHHPFGTMGHKYTPAEISTSPGPAQYDSSNLDAYKFRGPNHSMGQLHPKIYDVTSPGPAEYMPTKCENGPSYTFGTKHSGYQSVCYSTGDNDLNDERASKNES